MLLFLPCVTVLEVAHTTLSCCQCLLYQRWSRPEIVRNPHMKNVSKARPQDECGISEGIGSMPNECEESYYLTFSQRVGGVPLPEPMKLENLSKNFRCRVARVIRGKIQEITIFDDQYKQPYLKAIFADYNCEVLGKYDEPRMHNPSSDMHFILERCMHAKYDNLLTLIEFILRSDKCPEDLRDHLNAVFDKPPCVAYHVLNISGCLTIVPRASLVFGAATRKALETVEGRGPVGANAHFRKALERINEGSYADSVRESIHAMEAVARTIDNSSRSLGKVLESLEHSGVIKHKAISRAFKQLYGYTSDEEGIRHSMLNKDSPDVGMDEAMFMFGACAAGADYLVMKHRS